MRQTPLADGSMVFSLVGILPLYLICIPLCCSAFRQLSLSGSRSRSPHSYWTRESRSRILHQSTADENSLRQIRTPDQDILARNKSSNEGTELWLDLRGTSLTPTAALELWHLQERRNNDQEQPLKNNDGTIHYSLMAKASFTKCLMSLEVNTRKAAPPQSSNKYELAIGVLVVAENNDGGDMESIFLQPPGNHRRSPSSLSSTRSDTPLFGRVLALQASSSMPILPDPLPAMEVVSRGQWVILDTHGWKKVEEADRMSMALPLVELLSSGALSSESDSISGSSDGGIGLTCRTKNEVVQAAMFIQSLASGRGRNTHIKTLESGIVITDSIDDGADTPAAAGRSRIQNSDKANNFAIIVPFDWELLQTATLLLGDSVNNGDEI